MPSTRKVCVFGPGALGGMMAVMLSRAGFDTSALARPDRAARINAKGITLLTGGETFNAKVRASSDPKELGPQDLVVIMTKSNNLREVAPNLAPLCGPNTPLVFLLNGIPWWFFDGFKGPLEGTKLTSVDPEGYLERTIPKDRLVWGTIECGAQALPDETVLHTAANRIVIGRPDNSTRGLEDIAAVFRAAKYESEGTTQIRDAIWQKLQGNTALNPVSALTLATGNQMMADDYVTDLIVAIVDETRRLGEKLGLDLGVDFGQRLRQMGRNAGAFKTSMMQDMIRGRDLETDAIMAAPIEIADKLGVPMPFAKTVLGLLRTRRMAMAAS